MRFKDLFKRIDNIKNEPSYKNVNVNTRLAMIFSTLNEALQEDGIDISILRPICNNLIDIVNLSLSGKRNRAFSLLYSTYFEGNNISRLNIKDYNTRKKTFYRMRNSQEYVQYERDEMYHIPFEKNHLVVSIR